MNLDQQIRRRRQDGDRQAILIICVFLCGWLCGTEKSDNGCKSIGDDMETRCLTDNHISLNYGKALNYDWWCVGKNYFFLKSPLDMTMHIRVNELK